MYYLIFIDTSAWSPRFQLSTDLNSWCNFPMEVRIICSHNKVLREKMPEVNHVQFDVVLEEAKRTNRPKSASSRPSSASSISSREDIERKQQVGQQCEMKEIVFLKFCITNWRWEQSYVNNSRAVKKNVYHILKIKSNVLRSFVIESFRGLSEFSQM